MPVELDMSYEVRPVRPFRQVVPVADPVIAARNVDRTMRDARNQILDAAYRLVEAGMVSDGAWETISEVLVPLLDANGKAEAAMEAVHNQHGAH